MENRIEELNRAIELINDICSENDFTCIVLIETDTNVISSYTGSYKDLITFLSRAAFDVNMSQHDLMVKSNNKKSDD